MVGLLEKPWLGSCPGSEGNEYWSGSVQGLSFKTGVHLNRLRTSRRRPRISLEVLLEAESVGRATSYSAIRQTDGFAIKVLPALGDCRS